MTEHGALEAAGADAADADAVVFGACIDVLERSPGNCTGISGSTDDRVRAPTADPVDEAPTGSDADAFDVGRFNGSKAQADPARALPADVFDGEQPVPLKLVPREPKEVQRRWERHWRMLGRTESLSARASLQ